MKKIAVILLSFAFAFANIGIFTAQAATAATLSLSPTNTTVKTGDSFSLSVLVNPNGESLDTARVNLSWDATKLEAQAFELGSLFPNLSPSNSISNTAGTLSYGAYKFGTAVTASGTLGTVTFRALASGSATVSVSSDSKLISDGAEKINTSALGKTTVTISGVAVKTEAPSTVGDTTTTTTTSTSASAEAAALKYFGAIAGHLPSTAADWAANKCIAYGGCQASPRDLDKEQKALTLYTKKYNALPATSMEWNVIHAIAYTNVFINWESTKTVTTPAVTVTTPATTPTATTTAPKAEAANPEKDALKYFGAFYGRMPASSEDWAALKCMAYGGCQGSPRDVEKEKAALKVFGAKYGKLPSTSLEWNVLNTIAYKLTVSTTTTTTTTTTAPATSTTTTTTTTKELTIEQQAIGWFGKIYGRLPSLTADWNAVKYMVSGYKPAKQDLDAESAAIKLFASKFGHLPSSDQDWNIIAAIAYSGAK
ncbi:hypothetical protein HYV69_00815 [Candidatus Uhrbacteria bacterium]|nr:hypothetical protein [Candidatus Uhrbacteria bacterium]